MLDLVSAVFVPRHKNNFANFPAGRQVTFFINEDDEIHGFGY